MCEPESPSAQSPSPLLGKRLTCAECHKSFRSRGELIWHSEACLVEAFENEVYAATSETYRPKFNSTVYKHVPAGITVKAADEHPRQEHIHLKLGEQIPTTSSQSVALKLQFEDDVDSFSPQTIEGPGGLQLMVSVEKTGSRIRDTIDGPPILDPPIRSETGFNEDEEEGDDSDEIEGMGMKLASNYTGSTQVLGALANASDDPFKPKMECPTCGLILYRHNFAAHYRIHTGELPFACSYCSRRFRTTSTLKVHVRAHTGEKPYSCTRCDYATITKRNLDRHILIHHVQEPKTKGPTSRKSRYRSGPIQESSRTMLVDAEYYEEEDIESSYDGKPLHYVQTGVSGPEIMARATAETLHDGPYEEDDL